MTVKDLSVKGRPSLGKTNSYQDIKAHRRVPFSERFPCDSACRPLWNLGTVASRSLIIYFICNMTLFSPMSQVGCKWGAEMSILSSCTAASLVPDDCQSPNRHGLTGSKLCTALTRAGPYTGYQLKDTFQTASLKLEMPPQSTFWGVVGVQFAQPMPTKISKPTGNFLSLAKIGLSIRFGHIWDKWSWRAVMAPFP